ncbi:MAG: hypothetical protein RBU27_07465 [Bacteroidota bacterium]|nr:hypothetical protein [Bacteroidota bacterium]
MHRDRPYHRQNVPPRIGGMLLMLIAVVQLLSPLHSWLESSTNRVHHDGFVWYAAPSSQEDCHDTPCAAADVHEVNGTTTGQDPADGCCSSGARDAASDASGCEDGHCHDRECHAGCVHISIQSVLHTTSFDTDIPLTSAVPSLSTAILPGTYPETFLPPRS